MSRLFAANGPDSFVWWSWIGDHLQEVRDRTTEHLELTLIALAVGFLLSALASLVILRFRRTYAPITWVAGILYTIPSLALFSFLVTITGFTRTTAEIGLVSYTLLILIRNTVAGVDGVPASVKEAADGMGYTPLRRFFEVDLRLATPAIVAGLRIAAVTTIGLVTVTALIGEGGYGRFIADGLDRDFSTPIVLGGALSVLMAIVFDVALVALERVITPWAAEADDRVSAPAEFIDYITTAANWSGRNGITHRLADHVRVSAISVVIASAIAVPVATILGHIKRGGLLAAAVVNIGRAIPSFAIVSLMFPLSLQWGFSLGFLPTIGALVLLAIPPIFTNTYTGVRDVDASVVEAARGMGMRREEVITRVEVPAALPLVITGLRVSAVQVVATATLGALVGFGGLGAFIVAGFSQQDDGKLLTGAVLVALLAIVTEVAFGVLDSVMTPWTRSRGWRPGRARDRTLAAPIPVE